MLQLHAQSIPSQTRHQEIFRTFDALSPGDAFELINSHAPWPLLEQLQTLRPAAFDWNVLEAGPVTFRVEVRKRPEAAPRGVQESTPTETEPRDRTPPQHSPPPGPASKPERATTAGC